MYSQLQLREIFHLEFLRWFAREIKRNYYVLKGGANLRFFFKSARYSENMDIDAQGIRKDRLIDAVMGILESVAFQDTLIPFGIERVVPPNIANAKQTEIAQRFKAHLLTHSGEDLFTKIEFSKRGFKGAVEVESVSYELTRIYKIPPVLVPHYNIDSAIRQKIEALSSRSVTQARDLFDLYILSAQYKKEGNHPLKIPPTRLKEVSKKLFDIDFTNFKDVVLSYFSEQDRNVYDSPEAWDEIKLKTANFLEGLCYGKL